MMIDLTQLAATLAPHVQDLENIARDTDRSAESHALYAIADEFRVMLGLRRLDNIVELLTPAERHERLMGVARGIVAEPSTREALEYLRRNGD